MLLGNFLGWSPIRAITLGILAALRLFMRFVNLARARALFPTSRDVFVHWTAEIKQPENVTLGKGVIIGQRCTIGAAAPIYLGDDVHLSKGVLIDTGYADITTLPPYKSFSKPIRIERGVWLGAGSMVLAGVTVGENSVVAAGAIVRKSVPPNTVVSSPRPTLQSLADIERVPR
jgi:acetyltransferase-like isoleucine patch superfamily enzyme